MGDYTPQSRSEEILYDTIHSLEYTERPQSRIEELLLELKAVIEAGSGTTDYDDLENKPSINNVELSGDKSLADLGAASEEAVAAKASQSDIAPTFSDATAYTVGDVVYHDGSLYRFTANHSAGAWDSADVESVTVDDLVDGLKPVDSITNGDMRPVTSNAVYDALALKADSPVDAVTDGDMRPVTSNAVYDYLNDRLIIENVAFSDATIASGGFNTYKKNVSKDNYTFIGIIGIGVTNIDLQPVEWGSEQLGTVAYCSCKNSRSSSLTAHPILKCLYLKSN